MFFPIGFEVQVGTFFKCVYFSCHKPSTCGCCLGIIYSCCIHSTYGICVHCLGLLLDSNYFYWLAVYLTLMMPWTLFPICRWGAKFVQGQIWGELGLESFYYMDLGHFVQDLSKPCVEVVNHLELLSACPLCPPRCKLNWWVFSIFPYPIFLFCFIVRFIIPIEQL